MQGKATVEVLRVHQTLQYVHDTRLIEREPLVQSQVDDKEEEQDEVRPTTSVTSGVTKGVEGGNGQYTIAELDFSKFFLTLFLVTSH